MTVPRKFNGIKYPTETIHPGAIRLLNGKQLCYWRWIKGAPLPFARAHFRPCVRARFTNHIAFGNGVVLGCHVASDHACFNTDGATQCHHGRRKVFAVAESVALHEQHDGILTFHAPERGKVRRVGKFWSRKVLLEHGGNTPLPHPLELRVGFDGVFIWQIN